ncbi:sugar-binding protein [Seongchinamella unica]|nr:sugar-binding protein [Seongchinamella unica]
MDCIRTLQLLLLLTASGAAAAGQPLDTRGHDPDRTHYLAPRADIAPEIDGIADDEAWMTADWRPIDNIWLGGPLDAGDFQGRYKLVWTPQRLYLLVEILDDVLVDFHRDPLQQYWDDDCLEIFIDEDHSGGNHQYNHNAFAYHLSLDNQAIDIGTNRKAQHYNHHVTSKWRQTGDHVIWEVAVDVYDDQYSDSGANNQPVALHAGKIMGFMLAYCDNDRSELREHFIGSEHAAGDHKDRGWIDAGLFGTLELAE